MAESVILDAPIYVDPGATKFRLAWVTFNPWQSEIRGELREWDTNTTPPRFVPGGKVLPFRYDGEEADTRNKQLNKSNNSTTSMEKRIINQLIADGKLGAGTVSGTPD